MSKKQGTRNRKYAAAKDEFLSKEENRVCAICGSPKNLSIHHTKGRGSKSADASTFVTLCLSGRKTKELYPLSNHSHSGGCHGWVEANRALARNTYGY